MPSSRRATACVVLAGGMRSRRRATACVVLAGAMRSRRRATACVVLTLSLLAASADAASSATLATSPQCWAARSVEQRFAVSGAGFPPSTVVRFEYLNTRDDVQYVMSSPTGALSTELNVPLEAFAPSLSPTPLTFTVQASNEGTASVYADLQVTVVGQALAVSNVSTSTLSPLGRPALWRFGGLPGAVVYGHYLYNAPRFANYRYRYAGTAAFGRTEGPCGTLTVRRRVLAGIPRRRGFWLVNFDTDPRYRRGATPAFSRCFASFRKGRRWLVADLGPAPCARG